MNSIYLTYSGIEEPQGGGIEAFCQKVLAYMGIDNWEVSLLLCNDRGIRELNRDYRGQDVATDVLSFGQGEPENDFPAGKWPAGDIVVSMENLEKQYGRGAGSGRYCPAVEEELKRLLVHGLLHLKGMDHHDHNYKMIDIQESILKIFKKEKIF